MTTNEGQDHARPEQVNFMQRYKYCIESAELLRAAATLIAMAEGSAKLAGSSKMQDGCKALKVLCYTALQSGMGWEEAQRLNASDPLSPPKEAP